MSSMLSLPQNSPPSKRPWTLIKIFLGIALFIVVLLCWFMLSRLESGSSSLTLNMQPVTSHISTALKEVFVTPLQVVQKGQRLARIDVSGYTGQLPHAVALVRGTFAGDVASRVAEVSSLEADMVQRVALARHEENLQRQLMEHLSTEHARALLYLRSLVQNNSAKYRAAVTAEQNIRQKFHRSKATLEFASRQRSAIEGELYKIRAERAQSSGYASSSVAGQALSAAAGQGISEHIVAEVSGQIVGRVPQVGDIIPKGTAAFYVLPEGDAPLKLLLTVSERNVPALKSGSHMYLMAENTIFSGRVHSIKAIDKTNFVVELHNDSTNFMEFGTLYTQENNARKDNAQGEARAHTPSQQSAANATTAENVVTVRAIFWPDNILTRNLAPLDFVITPVLWLWEQYAANLGL